MGVTPEQKLTPERSQWNQKTENEQVGVAMGTLPSWVDRKRDEEVGRMKTEGSDLGPWLSASHL